MIKGIIYCAISPNGKKYYGKTCQTLHRRKKLHENLANRNSQYYFSRALRKYGITNFEWEIIEIYELNKLEIDNILNDRETYWIEKEKTYLKEYGYNMTHGGDGGPFFEGKKHTEETKRKMSEIRKGIKKSNEHKKRISESVKKSITLEEKEKRSKRIKGSKNPMFGKPAWNRGLNQSEETKTKISEKLKEYVFTKEHKRNISNAISMEKNGMYGKHHSDEARKKISIAAKKLRGPRGPYKKK